MASFPAKDKLTVISNLATMLSAGIPILEAVEALLPENKGGAKKFLKLTQAALTEGKPISYAMGQMPRDFDAVTMNLVRAAEEAGTLEETLKDLQISIKKDIAFRDELRASMTYPIFIFVIFFGVLLLILLFVVPRISKVFLGLRMALPPATMFMINVSDALVRYWPFIIVGFVIVMVILVAFVRAKKRQVVNALLKLPLLNHLGRTIDLTRFTRSMGLLLRAGIPVSEALELSEAVVSKREMAQMVEKMKDAVSEGLPLSEGLQQSKSLVPPLMIRIVETAEHSGTLEKTMQELSEYFQNQVSAKLKTISTLIEPIMIVVIGLLVGGMMLAIIAPIYSLISQINTR